ncbi:MAG: DEAD/DEAH box helicase [Verrucomicrobiota bacterium]
MSGLEEVTTFFENRFVDDIRALRTLDASQGEFIDYPASLHPSLRRILQQEGIRSLYKQQYQAFEQVSSGRDTLLVSSTASGKTLAFLLPVLNEYMKADTPFSTMLMYPTKALSRDQEGTLGRLLKTATGNQKLGTFDGDTPREERRNIQRSADFMLTNPDMLHAGILPNHNRRWSNYLSRLRFIIIDEIHSYRGAFGSHVANVLRRLLRVCHIHGSNPLFICSSATVGNPAEHAAALCHRHFEVVTADSSPRSQRDIYFVTPPLLESQGAALYRKGPGSITVPLLRNAAENGVRTICFCRARQQVERLYKAVTDGRPALRSKIKPYRGGLLPNERRQLERDLFEGRITAIITTNALELGIDIGDLDLCILSGHPGTVASFWQQAGRAGRRGSRAMIVFIGADKPVDQYLVNHPEFIMQAPVEQAWLNADNPYVFLQHLPCAAYEHPLRESEEFFSGDVYDMAVNVLSEDNTIVPYRGCYRYAHSDYPARGTNLRGLTDYNVQIYCGTEIIGEIDPIGARGTLYKDAVYQHLGRKYLSRDLDLEKKLCQVEEINVDYYTEAVWENRIEMVEEEAEKALHGARLKFGFIHVNKQPKLYKKIRERTFENIGYGPITLPAFEYDTMGLSLLLPAAWKRAVEEVDKRYVGAALFGLSYLLRHAAPSLAMADLQDIETDVSLVEEQEQEWQSALFLYDTHEGGVGYAEKIYEKIDDCFTLCQSIIEDCECQTGCPACVPPLPPGVNSEELEELLIESDAAVVCTKSLLEALIEGVVKVPEVRELRHRRARSLEPAGVDEEQEKTRRRLERASVNLRKSRGREH